MEMMCDICEKKREGYLMNINGEKWFKGKCGHTSRAKFEEPKSKSERFGNIGIGFKGGGFHVNDYK